jgi:hypothetical protein
MENFLEFDHNISWMKSENKLTAQDHNIKPHLVYIHGSVDKDLEILKNKLSEIDKVVFLANEGEDSVELVTSFRFKPKSCNEIQFSVINRFTRRKMRWENSNFFVDKFKNNKCLIMTENSFLMKLDSLMIDILNATAIRKQDVKAKENVGHLYVTTVLTREHVVWLSYVFDMTTLNIFIPPGELYTEYEKFFLPFDDGAWVAILVTILGTLVAIQVIKRLSPRVTEMVFGKNNKTPVLNFVSIILNGSQHTALVENSARMFLMVFILWSLVIR